MRHREICLAAMVKRAVAQIGCFRLCDAQVPFDSCRCRQHCPVAIGKTSQPSGIGARMRLGFGGLMLKLLRGVIRFFSDCYGALGEPQQDSTQSPSH